jgi:dUTP pyrophosphatase
MEKVKIKRLHKDAVIPSYSRQGDAGMDLVATSRFYDDFDNVCYGTGLAIEIPEGYVGLLFPRSSISKTDLTLRNSVGIIDSGYRGEIIFKFNNILMSSCEPYNVKERIGQLIIMPYPTIEFEEVEELSTTERGAQGFGSSGK